MAHDMAPSLASRRLPARTGFAAGSTGIQPQASDGHENVAFPRINRDPLAFAFFTVVKEISRWNTALDEARFPQHIRDRTRAIVTGIGKPSMATTPLVRHSL